MISFAKFHPNFQRILLKIWQFLLRFRSRNLYKMFAQNAGNRISEVLDFKIFRGGDAPGPPYKCRVIRHPSLKTVDPPLPKRELKLNVKLSKISSTRPSLSQ